ARQRGDAAADQQREDRGARRLRTPRRSPRSMSRNRHSRTPSERHFTSAPRAMARFVSKQVDPVNVAVRLAFVLGPARMDAGVAAVERAVVPCEAMRIGIGFRKLRS